MFRGASWIRRAGVALLLLASLGAGTVALPHADGADDFACTSIAVAHDESAHYIGADATPAPAEADHCFLCHSLRSFYPAFDKFQQHHYSPRTERLHLAPVDRASARRGFYRMTSSRARFDWPRSQDELKLMLSAPNDPRRTYAFRSC